MAKLTKRFIESIKPPTAGETVVWDDELKGFCVRVWPTGRITYMVYYRPKSGPRTKSGCSPQRKMSLGRHGAISPPQARNMALQVLGQVAAGKDPAYERARVRGEPSFDLLANEYIKRRCSQKKSGAEDTRILNKDAIPRWRNHLAREITRKDVIQLIDRVKDRGAPIMANRTLSVIKRVFNFGIARDLVETNPTLYVESPAAEKRRDRVLSDKEITIFWERLNHMESTSDHVKAALKLILILGQRPGEIVNMEWDEIDLDTKVWDMPGDKTKNGLFHRVPLSSLAFNIVGRLDRHGSHVFPSRLGSGLSTDRPVRPSALAHALRRNQRLFSFDHFTPHDLRRTAASGMASIGVNRHIIKRILNHAERDVTSIYDRYSYYKEKREALEAWSTRLNDIITGKESKIIPIAR